MKTGGFETQSVEVNCELHGRQTGIKMRLGGEWRGGTCPACDMAITEQHRERDMREFAEKMQADRRRAMQVPVRYQAETLDTYRITEPNRPKESQRDALATCRGIVARWPDVLAAGETYTFAGRAGTGKTHLACAVMSEVAERDRRCTLRYAAWPDVVSQAKATYGRRDSQETAEDVVERYARVDLLVLDELGVKAGSEHDHDLLFRLIRQRYDDRLPTLYITNLSPGRMQEVLGERIYDRLCEGWLVPCDWGSYRQLGVAK